MSSFVKLVSRNGTGQTGGVKREGREAIRTERLPWNEVGQGLGDEAEVDGWCSG